ncbi:glycosyltransferase family 4 protein [Halopseudomonas formosensis]|uniref:Glycosyltransferase family 4 protein n=1 Tax=Halopseudomonas formosensis TaxID=1002526 RepID=A0ABU5BXM5_9GAMM|nr:glycosyltransferase family 4 protein [Halopseudomonas formosensis]MDX9687532.1 glycosyltransferase family 4 protein [Halopseudomonas formosensis]
MRKKLLFVVNDLDFFISHRLAVAREAVAQGYIVSVISAPASLSSVQQLKNCGMDFYSIRITRSGKNPFVELFSLFSLIWMFWKMRPDIIHLVTIKPVLYGGIASIFSPVKSVVAAVSGLGFVFMNGGSRESALRHLVEVLYRFALGKKRLKVIFQNPDDRDLLVNIKAITLDQVEMIRGSGVDLSLFDAKSEPQGLPVVCFAARLLRDKGIYEFINAARILRNKGVLARFVVAGDIDPGNPTSVSAGDLERWRDEGAVEVLGYQRDIAALFSSVNLVVLPSYREGLPKVLIEAAAAGRAVVTTDVPGCRDAIEPDVTGLLVPAKNAELLAEAIEKLVVDDLLRKAMGAAGRDLAEREFGIEKVIERHLDIYAKVVNAA